MSVVLALRFGRVRVALLVALTLAGGTSAVPLLFAQSGTPIALEVAQVPLDSGNPKRPGVGRFIYAGGLELKAAIRFGGLSALHLGQDGRLLSVCDDGQFFEARLVLGGDGRVAGMDHFTLSPLIGTDGKPLTDKSVADAEGLAVLQNGDRLVSFERQHRILRYPVRQARPVQAPAPDAAKDLPPNGGLEALTALPSAGAGAYLAGSEGGTVWQCELAGTCRETRLGSHVPEGFGLTALAVSPDGQTLGLVARSFSPERGVRVQVRLLPRAALNRSDVSPIDELVLDAPLTRDNVEGLALARGRDRGLRLYLLTDNNFSAAQHTYLLAFDWSPE